MIVFFAVSGYCMAMTASGRTFRSFWRARWRRLIPAFIVCVIATYLVEAALPTVRPDRGQGLFDLGATLLCIPTFDLPCELAYQVGLRANRYVEYAFVDGALWSLLVEFRFYLVFSLIYFVGGRRIVALRSVAWAPILGLSLLALIPVYFGQGRAADFFPYLPFFAFGIATHDLVSGRVIGGLIGTVLSLTAVIFLSWSQVPAPSVPFTLTEGYIYAFEMLTFLGVVTLLRGSAPAGSTARLVSFFAGISYPLYLLHQDIGLVLIGATTPIVGAFGAPAIMFVVAVAVAYAVHSMIELPYWRGSRLSRPAVT